MNAARSALAALALGLVLAPLSATAQDIDIYSNLSNTTGAPNLLIVMDNAAPFTSNYAGFTDCSYDDAKGTKPGLYGTNGAVEQCAINNVINSLPVNSDGTARVNVGIMVYNGSQVTPYSGACTGSSTGGYAGGCLIYPLTPMTTANKTTLMAYVKSWSTSSGSGINISTNNEATAATVQEAWAYLAGQKGMSGTTYTAPATTSGCQGNYVVFVANAMTTNGTPGDASSSPGTVLATTIANRGGLTQAQQNNLNTLIPISGSFGINNVFSCSPNPYTLNLSTSHTETSGMYADEWAQYMAQTDLTTGAMPYNKNIVTYTIGVLSSSCQAQYAGLLSSMASVGTGKYYAVGSASDLANALNGILNEVQAVNSVFSSATLPVSVNTQGSYLNQIYMGMFRPDPNANPRWVGNVKQYQFQFDTNKNLYLADATGQPAISSSGTGFISTQAASFWSCTNATQAANLTGPGSPYTDYSSLPYCYRYAYGGTVPTNPTGGVLDAAGTTYSDPGYGILSPAIPQGFWINNPAYATLSSGKSFDLMDGEVVEKGAAGQQLRLENLVDDYTTAPGSSTNPRRLYTFCPGGTANQKCACKTSGSQSATYNGSTVCASLNDATNVFANQNVYNANNNPTGLIQPTIFGGSNSFTLSTLTRSGSTAYATSLTSIGGSVGQQFNNISITGATPSDYNGIFTITVTGTNTFTYTVGENPPATASGAYMLQAQPPTYGVYSITRTYSPGPNSYYTSNLNQETATVTLTGPLPSGWNTGTTVLISGGGTSESAYNGVQTISAIGSATVNGATVGTFSFPVAISPATPAQNTYRVSLHNTTAIAISSITVKGNTATVTTYNSHNLNTNDLIQISSTGQSCLNTANAVITVTGSNTFTYTGIGGNCPNVSTGYATPAAQPRNLTTLTRVDTTSTVTATGTFTNITSSDLASGDQVDITLVPPTTGTAATNEGAYVGTYTITCATTACLSFTYSNAGNPSQVVTSPIYPASSQFTVSQYGGATNITQLTRADVTATQGAATATLSSAVCFTTPPSTTCNTTNVPVSILAQPGTTPPPNETAYLGNFIGTCTVYTSAGCTTLTYGPIKLTPDTPASGTIKVVNPNVPPDAGALVDWVRGDDNAGDELSMCQHGATTPNCPNPPVTVRPSIHGDALHSRPVAVDYGTLTDGTYVGVVVYYGTNDGVYHAINGNQTTNIGTVEPGGELWGFIAPEFYAKLARQRANSPQLLLPSTAPGISPTPQPKDYFIDGPTGLLQDVQGTSPSTFRTSHAYIYIGARRGGDLLYALDVSDPTNPKFLWKLNSASPNMDELGQTWSLPQVARVAGYMDTTGTKPVAKPVIIMGAGYDAGSEDAEPPVSSTLNGGGSNMASDNMGRGIYVLDAMDGHVIWEARHYSLSSTVTWPGFWERVSGYDPSQGGWCNGTPPAAVICDVGAMNYSIPADITLLSMHDSNGYIDRLYATDTGGNVWRIDLEPAAGVTPDKWQITELAALGCAYGPCSEEFKGWPTSATSQVPTQRKFFFPAEVIGASSLNNGAYDAVFIGSGDREHPLQTQQAYNVANRMYMIKDFNTGNDSISQIYPVTEGAAFTTTDGTATGIPASLADCTGGTCSTAPTYWGASTTATGLTYDQLSAFQQGSGYYITLGTGEKVVNASMTAAGYVYFGTNQPAPSSSSQTQTCTSNLGIARGYQLAPYSARYASVVYAGGGLPPSPVSGIVNIQVGNSTVAAPFCVGCPSPLTGGNNCAGSALAACKPTINVPANRHRNYWYLDNQ